jgi:sulfite reductase (NADPH) hemoprotein beta-component
MYQYNRHDQQMIDERVQQFRGQAERFIAGELEPQQFLPLRLQNGLYKQRLAYMLRIAIPYGNLSTRQLRKLAEISRKYDKGFGHFSTRQNLQLNWPELEDVPTILAELASVEMHAIQTSGNCIRNTTADHFSGVAADEVEDARPYCEIIRQWSTFHPEFAFLPRKFKIAVCGSENDRAAMHVHDIGVEIVRNLQGESGFKILVGGGLGRTPVIGEVINEFLPKKHLLTYLEAILRVYNQLGRRDNKFKARIKILVRAMGPVAFRDKVEAEWVYLKDGPNTLTDEVITHAQGFFQPPAYEKFDGVKEEAELNKVASENFAFARWLKYNTAKHKQPGYSIVTLTLKTTGIPPGDATAEQMEAVADLADKFGFGEIRTSHHQNLILPDIRQRDLFEIWKAATQIGFATPNTGHLTDIICCPGGDYCSLANAKSIPVAEAIQRRFDDLDYVYDLGELDLNISGCMNACGHHHVGHIGILGVDKKGAEFYQISLGGNQGKDASIGEILGPSFSQAAVPDIIEKILQTYLDNRQDGEIFLSTFRRIGLEPFKERVYA